MPTIGVCTSARESSIKGLLSELEKITDVKVKFIRLPYNDLKNYRLPADEIDGVILCHSIHNRRFAITDVMDALYNEFLRHAAATFGKSNIVVIAHDFQWPFKSHAQHSKHSQLKEEKMAQFRIQQPTVFKSSSLAMICGRLDEELEMDEEDWIQLETFATCVRKVKPISSASGGDTIRHCNQKIKQATYFTYIRSVVEYAATAWDPHTRKNVNKIEMVQRRSACYVTGNFKCHSSVTAMLDRLHNGHHLLAGIYKAIFCQKADEIMPTIGVCTSAWESNIKGLLSELERIPEVKVKFIQLPYNDLKNYRLPADEIDGVILCHSIHNRRFAISDVMDALYNDFLPHAAKTLGESNIAVIGHDFQWPFKSADSRSSHTQLKEEKMASFRIQQPTAFKCSSLAMICGRLDKKLEMDEEDWEQLETFTTNVHKVKPMPNSFGGDQAGTVLKIVAVIVIFMLAQYLVSVCIKLIVSGIYKVRKPGS
ncbi:uncharacterized protein [Diadema setosum]|uniref:uncharacterized protein n=1 Tax=Diadema setosum TaxID=31175 RepID=UPI003B3A576D